MLHFARRDCESALTAEREGVDTEPVHEVRFLWSIRTTGLWLQSWSVLRLQCQWPETLCLYLSPSFLSGVLPPTHLSLVHSVGEEKVFYHSTSCGLQVCSLLSFTSPYLSVCLLFISCLSSLKIKANAAWLIINSSYKWYVFMSIQGWMH